MGLIITILPVVTKDLPISSRFAPYDFLSRCKFSTLTTRQPTVEFYLLTFPRFPLLKKEHKSYFGKNRTHDFRTSRCAGYLLDHSGDELDSRPPVLSTSPLHTNSGCGKERRIIIGPWGFAKAAPVWNYLEVYWPCAGGLSAVNAIGTQLRDPIDSGLTRWRMAVS